MQLIRMQSRVSGYPHPYTFFTVLPTPLSLALLEVILDLLEVVTDGLKAMNMVQIKTHLNAARKCLAQGLDRLLGCLCSGYAFNAFLLVSCLSWK